MKRILIIEDDKAIAELERDYLELNGFKCDIAERGTQGLEMALKNDYDLLLIDIMLPGTDGFGILSEVRRVKQIPAIFLSARGGDIDKIRGLELGADDYMTKPFSPNELVARVKAHISRHDILTGHIDSVIRVKSMTIDTEAHCVKIDSKVISLTAKEYALLEFLARNPNHVFSKEILFDRIWGMDSVGELSTVAVHIQRLRDKLSVKGEKYIDTVWGVGYRMSV